MKPVNLLRDIRQTRPLSSDAKVLAERRAAVLALHRPSDAVVFIDGIHFSADFRRAA